MFEPFFGPMVNADAIDSFLSLMGVSLERRDLAPLRAQALEAEEGLEFQASREIHQFSMSELQVRREYTTDGNEHLLYRHTCTESAGQQQECIACQYQAAQCGTSSAGDSDAAGVPTTNSYYY